MTEGEKEDLEISLFLETVDRCYGYNFKNYARASLKRRLLQTKSSTNCQYISEMIPLVINERGFIEQFLKDMSVTVTEMYRDPNVFKYIRNMIIPMLKTYPFVKIWHAGCATGEEVYSMAILLKEEGFLDKVHIYASDYNEHSLKIAKEGIYPLSKIKMFTDNYIKSGGKASFSDYYRILYKSAKLTNEFDNNITFLNHNLITDHSIGEVHLIICRNVLIYFNQELQNHVLSLFHESLVHRGFLCIGTKENIKFSNVEKEFEVLSSPERVYQKI